MNAQQVIEQAIGKVRHWLGIIVGLALLVLIAGATAKLLGHAIPMIPAANHETIAYLCGAYWLLRKAA